MSLRGSGSSTQIGTLFLGVVFFAFTQLGIIFNIIPCKLKFRAGVNNISAYTYRVPNQPDPNTVATSFTLPRQLLALVEQKAKTKMVPKSAFIRQALMNSLTPAERALVESQIASPHEPAKSPKPRRQAAPKAKRAQLRDIDTVSLGVFGTIPAGFPEGFDASRHTARQVRVRRGRFPDGAFGLDVRGDSMNAAHPDQILHGETVILLPPDLREPQHGDIVAALCDGQTTLKRLICLPGKPCTLHAESTNPAFARDIVPVHDLAIQGVMIGKL